MNIRSVRGTHDLIPGSVELWQRVEQTARRVFDLYGYAEIRTPLLEETDLFARTVGAASDIVQKEMYSFADSKGKSTSLRPEGTAPVVRAYLEHHLFQAGPLCKLYYLGPMFRRERPQKGRYRQFHQIGAEALGTDHPAIEAEMIDMLGCFLEEVKAPPLELLINSVGCRKCRPGYVALLGEAVNRDRQHYCPDCLRRLESNPLRILDCKVPGCQPWIARLPLIQEHLCPACREHFADFRRYLDLYGIAYRESPRLVRGLDYYVRTTFEMVSERLGPTQNAVVGGGRYDGLAKMLGGRPAPGFGFALGLERLVLLLRDQNELSGEYRPSSPRLLLAYLDQATFEKALELARRARRQGLAVTVDFAGRSLKAQLRLADRLGAAFVAILGPEELESDTVTLKTLAEGRQQRLGWEEMIQVVSS